MLRRFQISNNKSLDGVLDQLNSRWVAALGRAARAGCGCWGAGWLAGPMGKHVAQRWRAGWLGLRPARCPSPASLQPLMAAPPAYAP